MPTQQPSLFDHPPGGPPPVTADGVPRIVMGVFAPVEHWRPDERGRLLKPPAGWEWARTVDGLVGLQRIGLPIEERWWERSTFDDLPGAE